jgi:hypothetical protein
VTSSTPIVSSDASPCRSPLSPLHSSTIQSLYALTQASATSRSFRSANPCPQNRVKLPGKHSDASTQLRSMSSRRALDLLPGSPALEEVRRLDDVVVNTDDPRKIHRLSRLYSRWPPAVLERTPHANGWEQTKPYEDGVPRAGNSPSQFEALPSTATEDGTVIAAGKERDPGQVDRGLGGCYTVPRTCGPREPRARETDLHGPPRSTRASIDRRKEAIGYGTKCPPQVVLVGFWRQL